MKTKSVKPAVLAAVSVAVCLMAVLIGGAEHNDSVYTSLFYIPIIMAGLWYYKLVIPLTSFFVLYFISMDLLPDGSVPLDQIFRGIIMLLASAVLFYLGGTLKKKNDALEEGRRQLAVEKERLGITLLSIGDGVVSTDRSGAVVLMNEVAKALTGWQGESAVGRPFGEVFRMVNEFTGEVCDDPVALVLSSGQVAGLANHTLLVSKDGKETPIADSAAPIRDEAGNVCGAVLVFRDVTEEKRKQNEAEYLSLHDQLTGLGNRRLLEAETKRLDRQGGLPLSIVVGDVNGLKLTNDAFGHAMGDRLLKKAADTFRSVFRSSDIICRYGGDEFVVLLPGTNRAEAAQIIERLQAAFGRIEVGPVKLSISLGWAVKNAAHENVMNIFRAAEDMMYARKLTESIGTKRSIILRMVEKGRSHAARTEEVCVKAAEAFGLSSVDTERLKTACMFRDIGRIAAEESTADGEPEQEGYAFDAVKRHPEIGYRILNMVPDFSDAAEIVLAHHERWDGKGSPKGLKGADIPYLSRIVAVLDYYDSIAEDAADNAMRAKAAHHIMRHAGTRFDPDVARVFVEKVLGYQPVPGY